MCNILVASSEKWVQEQDSPVEEVQYASISGRRPLRWMKINAGSRRQASSLLGATANKKKETYESVSIAAYGISVDN
jgi:hypothetical protein